MKRIVILIALFCLVRMIVMPNLAAVQVANDAFTIGSKTAQSMEIQFALPDFEIVEENASGTVYQKINMQNSGYLTETGMPELPTLSTMIAIPNQGSVQVELIDTHTKMIKHIIPYPSQGGIYETDSRNLTINSACYEGSQIYPQEIVRYSDPQIMRDFRLVTIQVQPFAWDSSTHDMIVRERISIRVRFTDEPGINELPSSPNISYSFDKIYESLILNYRDFRPDTVPVTPDRIIMIYGSYSDPSFLDKLNQFAMWKRQKGADVRLISTSVTGTSNTAIKSYIQNLYNDQNSRPDYIVLIGDVTGSFPVPTWSTNGAGDYPYQMLAGGDQLGDCFIGRISAENISQLDVIFAKIYAYERDINLSNAQWLNRMLIVSDPYHDGISVVYLAKYIRDLSLFYNPDYTYTMLTMNSPSAASMNQAMNQGVGFFNYRGYIGMSGWSPSDNLVNGVKLPHTVIITCSTGSFTGTATTESFIRLGTAAVPKGAVTSIGMDTSGTHTMPNNALCGGIFDGIFAQKMRTMGEALLHSKLYMASLFGVSNPSMVASFTQWCNLMGDPTMEVYIAIPRSFATNAPLSLPIGTNCLDMNVVDQDALPVQDAWVTVTQSNVVIARALTDAEGYVYLPFMININADLVTITVSKHDYKPLIQIITPSAASLLAVMSLIDDDNVGNSSGNGDFSANSGETLEILIGLRNTTDYTITNLAGYITSDSPYATVIDSLVSYGSVAPNEMQFNLVPSLIQIAQNTPTNTMIRLTLHLTDGSTETYNIVYFIYVSDANLTFISSAVVDGADNALDPGETASFNVTIKNIGTLEVQNLAAELFSDNDLVTVEDSIAFFGNILVNNQATTAADNFILHGRNLLLPGMIIPLRMKLTNPDGFQQWVTFNLTVGTVTLHDPLGPDSYGYVIYDDTDTNYNECPVFDWIGIAPAEGGTGTALAISDPSTSSDEGDQMSSTSLATVNLPFTFQFYGEEYQQITVCSNGFIAMGVTENGEFRNYRLPGAMGPGAMIAPFWDDLGTAAGSGIYTWYDSANHRFVVEWYQMVNGYQNSDQETFQVILHDPAFYATSLGDGPIKIQYLTFNNVDSGATVYNHGLYSTIGIENRNQDVGLEYSFNNTYPTPASPLGNNRALYITNIPVYHDNAYLVMGETVIMDNNGNNIVEPGESVELGVQLLNIGNAPANEITAVISSVDPMVTITNNSSTYFPIAGDGAGFNRTAYTFNVSPQCPSNHGIPFLMTITTPESSWQRAFSVMVQSSELSFESYFLNDMAGNNNGIADANEDFLIIVNAKNNSDVNAVNLIGVIGTSNPLVTIQNAAQMKPILAPGDVIQFVYNVHFGAIAANTYVPFTFNVIADNASEDSGLFTVACGTSGVNLDFESNNGNFISESGWVWGSPTQTTAHSGSNVWATNLSGNYPDNANYSLKTPPVFIGMNSTLSFWHLLGCESGWDGGNVSVSTNNGSSWTVVPPTTGGTYITNITALSEPGFSGGPTSWTQVTFDLNQFANNEIIIKWHFGSDTIINGMGWFVDDVMLTGYSIKTGILSGTVSLLSDDNPAFAKVSLQNNFIANPDTTGAYLLYLPIGTYAATASMPYYESVTAPSFIISDAALTHTRDFNLIYLPAPTGLTINAEPDQSTVNLNWVAPENPFYPVLAYKVYRRMGPGNYSMLGQVATTFYEDNLTLAGHYFYYITPVYNVGEGAPSDIAELDFPVVSNPEENVIILVNALNSNYPNPFNPTTTISYALAKTGDVSLKIYNTKGQLVKTLVSEIQTSGKHTIVWNGLDNTGKPVASGMYLYRMNAGKYTSVKKMMLLK